MDTRDTAALIIAAATLAGPDGVTEDEMAALLAWAKTTRANHAMLTDMLDGKLLPLVAGELIGWRRSTVAEMRAVHEALAVYDAATRPETPRDAR